MIDEFAEFQYNALQNIEYHLKPHADPYIFVRECMNTHYSAKHEIRDWLYDHASNFGMYEDSYYPATHIPWIAVEDKSAFVIPIMIVIVDGEDLAFRFRLWFGDFQRFEFDRFIACLRQRQTLAGQRRWLLARTTPKSFPHPVA